MRNKRAGVAARLAVLATCMLMLSAISLTRYGRLFNQGFRTTADADTTAVSMTDEGEIVVNTTRLAHDVQGYGGPTPLKLYVKEGKIRQIALLDNDETPSFLERVEQDIVGRYIGKTLDEARTMKVDALTGATLSSNAVIENIGRSLSELNNHAYIVRAQRNPLSPTALLALLTAVGMAVLPLFVKGRLYRRVQLGCNVFFLGLLSGTFVSYSSVVGFLANGFTSADLALMVLLATAFLYPLFGRPGHYCAWGCPLGSAQELMGSLNRRKFSLPKAWADRLKWFRRVLWGILMLLAWTGIFLEWMDYELFTAFIWQSAAWGVIIVAAVFLVASLFVSRPYCRFVCPTGTLLKMLNP